MEDRLNPVIEAYLSASNQGDDVAFLECFVSDAVVVDEGRTYHGSGEILGWFKHTRSEYDFTATQTGFREEADDWIVTCSVSGTFPGSPADISYRFKLDNSKIAKLTIE